MLIMAKASKMPNAFCLFMFFNSCFRLTLLLFYTNRVNTEKISIRLLFSFLKNEWNFILLFRQTFKFLFKKITGTAY